MKKAGSACGKIILSGEYAVVFGHPGIAVPSPLRMHARHCESPAPLSIEWKGAGEKWIDYARNVARLCECVTGTLAIETDLPLGKGMGSSTALVVAMARCFGADREAALSMEDAMNPGHSGLDFAVIWENVPLVFRKGDEPKPAPIDSGFLKNAVLIDAGTPAETTPELVAWMIDRWTRGDGDVLEGIRTIAACTKRLASGESPMSVFPEHHRAQVKLGVVPAKTQELIKKLEQDSGPAKVIGAGGRLSGGGMVLVLTADPERVADIASSCRMGVLPHS